MNCRNFCNTNINFSLFLAVITLLCWTIPVFIVGRIDLCDVKNCNDTIKPCMVKICNSLDHKCNDIAEMCYMVCFDYSLTYEEKNYTKNYCDYYDHTYCQKTKDIMCYYNIFNIQDTLSLKDYNKVNRYMSLIFPILFMGIFVLFKIYLLISKEINTVPPL